MTDLRRAIGRDTPDCAQCAADREAVARALALGPANELCGFRIERGSYFIGPCRLRFGHGGAHNPYAPGEMEADFERRFGFPPYVEVDLAGTNRTPDEAAGGHDDITNRWADKREAGQ